HADPRRTRPVHRTAAGTLVPRPARQEARRRRHRGAARSRRASVVAVTDRTPPRPFDLRVIPCLFLRFLRSPMAYVITQNCCKDASCVPVCPVDCIRPAGTSDGFDRAEMLYIDPTACIDCGACLEECPVDAIYHEDDLPPELERSRDINARYFQCHTPEPVGSGETPVDHPAVTPGSLRVAIVGTGPAASYAAQALVAVEGVEVDMFERLPTPYGLIRAGVAPDHQRTK